MPKNRFSNRIEKPVHPVFSIPVHNPMIWSSPPRTDSDDSSADEVVAKSKKKAPSVSDTVHV